MATPFLLLLWAIAASEPVDLVGTVRGPDSAVVQNAAVSIYTAVPRAEGRSLIVQDNHPDRDKKAATDKSGAFSIPQLDSESLFHVLVLADGYEPQMIRNADPAAGPLEIRLVSRDIAEVDHRRLFRGRVLDENDKPVVGATLTAERFKMEPPGRFSYTPDMFDSQAVTNAKGEFVIMAKEPMVHVFLRTEARGFAPVIGPEIEPNAPDQAIRLRVGATMRGRLVHAGQPVTNRVVGLMQVRRDTRAFIGPREVVTDGQGIFQFRHLPPDQDYFVSARMPSIRDLGGTVPLQTRAAGNGYTSDIGDLVIVPGHTLTGRVTLADGGKIPPTAQIRLASEAAWNLQTAALGADGQFKLWGIPPGVYTIQMRMPGYVFSSLNSSLDPLRAGSLLGHIDRDLADLHILLEPGVPVRTPPTKTAFDRQNQLRNEELRGAPPLAPAK